MISKCYPLILLMMIILRTVKGYPLEMMRMARFSMLQDNLSLTFCHLWTILCPHWMVLLLLCLRRLPLLVWNSGSLYVVRVQRTAGSSLHSTQSPSR